MRCYHKHYLLLALNSPPIHQTRIRTVLSHQTSQNNIRAMLPVVFVRAVTLAFALAATWMARVQYDRLAVGLPPCYLTLESCVFPPSYSAKAAQAQRSLVTKVGQKTDSYIGPVDPELAINDISEVHNEERDEVPPYFADGKPTLPSFIESCLENFRSLGEVLWFVGTLVGPWLTCTGAACWLRGEPAGECSPVNMQGSHTLVSKFV